MEWIRGWLEAEFVSSQKMEGRKECTNLSYCNVYVEALVGQTLGFKLQYFRREVLSQ